MRFWIVPHTLNYFVNTFRLQHRSSTSIANAFVQRQYIRNTLMDEFSRTFVRTFSVYFFLFSWNFQI